MAGLFGRLGRDAQTKQNAKKIKEMRNLVRAKKYQQALRVGVSYLKDVPENHDVLFIVGSIHYMQGRHKSAISFFEQALQIGSYDVEVLILKANSHYVLGQTKRAEQCCGKIREVDPENKAAAELLSKIRSD